MLLEVAELLELSVKESPGSLAVTSFVAVALCRIFIKRLGI
jgi:hypothetical protein